MDALVHTFWEFPNLVVSNLVVHNFCVEAPFCALLRSFVDSLLRSFALICVFLHPTAFRATAFGNCRHMNVNVHRDLGKRFCPESEYNVPLLAVWSMHKF